MPVLSSLSRFSVILCLFFVLGACQSQRTGSSVGPAGTETPRAVSVPATNQDMPILDAQPLPVAVWTEDFSELWSPVDQLEKERKTAAALKATQALLIKYRDANASQEVVRA